MSRRRKAAPKPGDVIGSHTCRVCGRRIVSVILVDNLGWATQVQLGDDFLAGSRMVRSKGHPGSHEWRCPDHIDA